MPPAIAPRPSARNPCERNAPDPREWGSAGRPFLSRELVGRRVRYWQLCHTMRVMIQQHYALDNVRDFNSTPFCRPHLPSRRPGLAFR